MFPLTSFAVTVTENDVPADSVPECCVATVKWSTAPAAYVIVAVVWLPVPLCTGFPLRVAENTPLPALDGAVTVAVYVPFEWSVVEPTEPVPEDRLNTTVEPPLVRGFPYASLAVTVSSCVLDPFAVIDALVGVSVDSAAFDTFGLTVIGLVVPVTAEIVAVIVGLSAALVSVNPVTVATPLVQVATASADLVGAVAFGELVAFQVITRVEPLV